MILFSALVLLPVAAGTWGSTTAAASTAPWYQAFSSGAGASSTLPAQDNKASDPFGNPTASATIPAGRGQFFGATVTAAGAPTAEVKLGGSSSWGSAVNAFSVASAETESRIFGSDSDDTSGSGKGGKGGKGSNSGGEGAGEGGSSRIFGSDGDSGDGGEGGGSGKGGSGKGGSSSGGGESRIFGNDSGGGGESGKGGSGKGGKGSERARARRTYEVLTSGSQQATPYCSFAMIVTSVGIGSLLLMKA